MQELKSQLARITKNQELIDIKVDKMYNAIIGEPEFKREGLIAVVKKNEAYIQKDKMLKAKIVGASFLGGAIWGVLLKIKDIIAYFN